MLICKDGCGAENLDAATQCQHCGRSLRSALRLHNPGTLVRHYRVLRVIGWGGFGAVYEAEDTHQPGSRVALKESFDPTGMTSFQGEFTALQQHQHPHLPRYEAMFIDQGNGYLVMEFIPGQSLEDVQDAEDGPLPEKQVLGFALQLCEVLDYLHHQHPPIIHRDLKPANVRLTPSGRIKLVDFGLFKQGTDTTKSSRMGLTPAYAPVEQHPLAPSHTDQRSDVYSLGATLYHLLTGQMPVSSFDRIKTPTEDPLVPPSRLNSRLSPHIATAISKAMCLKPEDRFPSIEAFQQAIMEPLPTGRIPTPPAQRPAPVTRFLGIGAGLAVLLTIIALIFGGRSSGTTSLSQATFLGQDGGNFSGHLCEVGTSNDNVHIHLAGLRTDTQPIGYSVQDRVGGGAWATPCNPVSNWLLSVISPGSGQADLYFKPFRNAPDNTEYLVTIQYGDGTKENVSVIGSQVTVVLSATFLGQDGGNFAGRLCTTGTANDNVHIHLNGLRTDKPVSVKVEDRAAGGVWATPCNPVSNWQLYFVSNASNQADIYFKPFKDAPDNTEYTISLQYSDGWTQTTSVIGWRVAP